MAVTRSTTRKRNSDDDASSKKRSRSCIMCDGMAVTRSITRKQKRYDVDGDESCETWSDLIHDALFLIMMQLGVIDYAAFSEVCKSWRCVAVGYKKQFMMSKPPMSVSICTDKDGGKECHLVDFEGRKLQILIPQLAGRCCIGVTCGYLILCGDKARDIWLVNPITRHQLRFPFLFPFPFSDPASRFSSNNFGASLVFSPAISGWVFVVFCRGARDIWFCVAGKREWTCVPTRHRINHLQSFNGEMYTLCSHDCLCQVTLFPTPKETELVIKNFPAKKVGDLRLVSCGENLYAMDQKLEYEYKRIYEVDLSKMEWVSRGKVGDGYGCFISYFERHVMVLPADQHLERFAVAEAFFCHYIWYFFHDCLDVNDTHGLDSAKWLDQHTLDVRKSRRVLVKPGWHRDYVLPKSKEDNNK